MNSHRQTLLTSLLHVMSEEQIAGQIGTMGKDADDKALGAYCASAANAPSAG